MFCRDSRQVIVFLILMPVYDLKGVRIQHHHLDSRFLKRSVLIDCYLPAGREKELSGLPLLLINDGQDLRTMGFEEMLDQMLEDQLTEPLLCVGIHCSADRKNEYGTAKILDYKGRGAKAGLYTRFILEELLPFLRKFYKIRAFKHKAFAGFSLGGLSALDIVWNHPREFYMAAVFSGSLWWRDKDQDDPDFDEDLHRIMHNQVRKGQFHPWQQFFFQTGTLDETSDRNQNGIIDAIDDTLALIRELTQKGFDPETAIRYVELADGRHDVPTWKRAIPYFLEWAWGNPDNAKK